MRSFYANVEATYITIASFHILIEWLYRVREMSDILSGIGFVIASLQLLVVKSRQELSRNYYYTLHYIFYIK
jgi:hypothetical protein